MSSTAQIESCPICGESAAVRPKQILIAAAWKAKEEGGQGSDGPDGRCFPRADHFKLQSVGEHPLEQFLDGFYCDRCGKGFVSEEGPKKTLIRRRLRP